MVADARPMMTPKEMIATALLRERNRAGLSLSGLAEAAGIAKSTLSQLEAREGNPSLETLWALATALGIPFAQLFETSRPEVKLIRAEEGERLSGENADISAVLLSSCPPHLRRDLYRMRFEPGTARLAAAHPPGTAEHVFYLHRDPAYRAPNRSGGAGTG